VEEDEAACPVDVAIPGPVLAEAGLGGLADEVQQPWRLGRCWRGGRLGGHGSLLTGRGR
jgi:hypothetical protein